MSDNPERQLSEEDAELEWEVRKGRPFTLEEAIGRLAGPGALKGESPIPRLQQAETEIANWLKTHLVDAGGALTVVLKRHIKGSELLLHDLDQPLLALARFCQQIVESDYLLGELVRAADVEWGREMCERPYFDTKAAPAHPDDPYTVESVRIALSGLVKKLPVRNG
jgi:hypothetical protein